TGSYTLQFWGMFNPYFAPVQGGTIKLGDSDKKWHTVYAVNGSIDTSDETEKIISAIGDCSWLYELEPISFRWKNDPARCHLGFSAQRVFEAAPKKDTWLVHPPVPVTGEDGQAVTDEDGQPVMSKWGMSKTELIAPMLRLIQEQKKMIDSLTERITKLESQLR
ncbi:MAG: tail fiber domain-containing protein, partial [Dehalococcoidia bacterium]|nr:tail fiber domain-containing protein [Dehalococcoidia bacterium]